MTEQTERERMQAQHEMRVAETGQQEATRVAGHNLEEVIKSPEFLSQLQDPDVDTHLFDWVKDEFGPVFSGAHILGDRKEHYETQQEFLNRNKAGRMKAERRPGRLLRENPKLLALAQGIQGTPQYPDPTNNPAFRDPMTSRKRRVVEDAAEVATTRQTMSIGGRGIDAVSTATVESRTVRNEVDEQSSATKAAREVFR